MAKKTGKDDLEPEDRRTWTAWTGDVRPLAPAAPVPDASMPKPAPAAPPVKKSVSGPAGLPSRKPSKATAAPSVAQQLDGHIDRRLRKGTMPIDGSLDLHGMTQGEALARLVSFVSGAHGRGARLLLVITGKSRAERDSIEDERGTARGVLNRRLPDWIALPPLDALVLKAVRAAERHGGGGAYYLYLRRDRAPRG